MLQVNGSACVARNVNISLVWRGVKEFPDVVQIVKKLESSRVRRAQRRAWEHESVVDRWVARCHGSPEPTTTRVLQPRGVFECDDLTMHGNHNPHNTGTGALLIHRPVWVDQHTERDGCGCLITTTQSRTYSAETRQTFFFINFFTCFLLFHFFDFFLKLFFTVLLFLLIFLLFTLYFFFFYFFSQFFLVTFFQIFFTRDFTLSYFWLSCFNFLNFYPFFVFFFETKKEKVFSFLTLFNFFIFLHFLFFFFKKVFFGMHAKGRQRSSPGSSVWNRIVQKVNKGGWRKTSDERKDSSGKVMQESALRDTEHWQRRKVSSVQQVAKPCIDDHLILPEDYVTTGDLSVACPQKVI